MNDRPIDDHEMPPEIDFGKGVRAAIISPLGPKSSCLFRLSEACGSIFLEKPQTKGVGLSELLSEVLKRDIEISEALK